MEKVTRRLKILNIITGCLLAALFALYAGLMVSCATWKPRGS